MPPHTTRIDRKLNSKEVKQPRRLKKETFIQTGKRGGDGQPGRKDSGCSLWRDPDWWSVGEVGLRLVECGRMGQAVRPLADPAAP